MLYVLLLFSYFNISLINFLSQGSRIHATIKYVVVKRVKPILKEGCLYAIKDIIVAENRLKYKTTKNKFKINFREKTNICEIFEDSFPSKMFEFKSFEDLKNVDVIDETELFGTIT